LILEMHDCLYAPDAPVNLLSVGAMLEHGFTFTITPQMVQIHPDPDRFTIADVIRRLCVLRGKFLLPKDGISDFIHIAMPVFLPRTPNGALFHERFGHPGIDLTNELLTGSSAEGLEEWNGTKMRGICDSCLKGKHPRFPY
ncbi:uncharacterized protein C8R40DRAFT_1013814, partial [Lentinula edodes]|uniref:uncharacterized protein n=1 Tax=Lentinula edodes TaxID=5353 RepID=UPI001E8DFDC2